MTTPARSYAAENRQREPQFTTISILTIRGRLRGTYMIPRPPRTQRTSRVKSPRYWWMPGPKSNRTIIWCWSAGDRFSRASSLVRLTWVANPPSNPYPNSNSHLSKKEHPTSTHCLQKSLSPELTQTPSTRHRNKWILYLPWISRPKSSTLPREVHLRRAILPWANR